MNQISESWVHRLTVLTSVAIGMSSLCFGQREDVVTVTLWRADK